LHRPCPVYRIHSPFLLWCGQGDCLDSRDWLSAPIEARRTICFNLRASACRVGQTLRSYSLMWRCTCVRLRFWAGHAAAAVRRLDAVSPTPRIRCSDANSWGPRAALRGNFPEQVPSRTEIPA
jgi:hypothetical protein